MKIENKRNRFDIRNYAAELKVRCILVVLKQNVKGDLTMSQTQITNEIKYKIALSLLNSLLEKGLITLSELKEIDRLNRNSFTPALAEVYV